MAGDNEILGGRFRRAAQRLLNMKGAGSVNELGSVITPQLSLHADADHRFNESWESFGFIANSLANATTGSSVRVRNPAGSGVLALFTRIQLAVAGGAAADTLVLEIGATAVDAGGANGIGPGLDTRTVRNTPLIVSINPLRPAGALRGAGSQQFFAAAASPADTL